MKAKGSKIIWQTIFIVGLLIAFQGVQTKPIVSALQSADSRIGLKNSSDVGYENPIEVQDTYTNYSIGDLNWTVGGFLRNEGEPLEYRSTIQYTYDMSSTEMHFTETPSSVYLYTVGAFAKVPVINGSLELFFEGRAKGDYLDAVNLCLLIQSNDTVGIPAVDWVQPFWIPGVLDTGFSSFHYNITSANYSWGDVEEVIIYFCYSDLWIANWNQEIWVRNLKVVVPTGWSESESPEVTDDIYEENDDFYEAASISVNTTHSLYAFDDDYFTLDLTSSQHIELILSFDYVAADLDLYLCDYSGEIIDGSEDIESPEVVNFDCTYTGTYYIVIVYFSGSIGLQYDLFIEVTKSAIIDDEYEDNDYLDEAATLPDQGTFSLFYADIDLFNITLSSDYTYTITMSFNSLVIDLDMYLLPSDFNGEEEDIEAYSNDYSSPEQFTFRPSYTDIYVLFIVAYVENEYDPITPSEYTLTISRTLYTTEDPGNGDETPNFTSFAVILIPLSIVALVMIYRKRK